jgi:hypothetical protein
MKLVWSGRSDLDGFEVAACPKRVKLLRGFGYTDTARALAQLVADHG